MKISKLSNYIGKFGFVGLICVLVQPFVLAGGSDDLIPVNVDNFARAETAAQFDRMLPLVGGKVNTLFHFREPTPLDRQSVIRMNRDTLYSGAVVDISRGATLTIPDVGERYLSVTVVNEGHYTNKIFHGEGSYELTMEEFDTSYVLVSVRLLVDASDPADIALVNALQDQMSITAVSAIPYTHPNYDATSYESTYKSFIELSKGLGDTKKMFGKKEDVDAVRHLIGTAFGFGGLPEEEAFYLNIEPNLPAGAYQLTVKDVPVDAFWSISLYNRDGYFEKNDYDIYSVNNIIGTPNEDGSFTINFGGDPDSVNFLPIMEGWNYLVRLYLPRPEVLNGTWSFPGVTTR